MPTNKKGHKMSQTPMTKSEAQDAAKFASRFNNRPFAVILFNGGYNAVELSAVNQFNLVEVYRGGILSPQQ